MQLAFNADMMFVLNNTDAPLYMRSGSNSAPNASYFDLYFPPVSYTILDPQGGWDYAGFLDNPSSDDCWVIFVYGYADEYRRVKELLGIWDWYLPNFDFSLYPASMYEWFFDFNIPVPPTNNWAFNRSGTADIFQVYNNGVGNVGQFTGSNWVRNTGVDTRKIIIYANFPAGVWLRRVQVQCGFTFAPAFPISVKVRTYSAAVSSSGLGSNVIDCVEFQHTSGAIGTPYISSFQSPTDYMQFQECAAMSIELNNGSPNVCSIQDIMVCGSGVYPFTTPDVVSCPGNVSSGFYFSIPC